jgi:hypothetical protein
MATHATNGEITLSSATTVINSKKRFNPRARSLGVQRHLTVGQASVKDLGDSSNGCVYFEILVRVFVRCTAIDRGSRTLISRVFLCDTWVLDGRKQANLQKLRP